MSKEIIPEKVLFVGLFVLIGNGPLFVFNYKSLAPLRTNGKQRNHSLGFIPLCNSKAYVEEFSVF